MIFEACRWASNTSRTRLVIQEDTLRCAWEHVNLCLEAGQILDTIGRRAEIQEEAESILAQIRSDFDARIQGDAILLTKTQLTNQFCKNPHRYGAMNTNRLYHEIIPGLVGRNLAKLVEKDGKLRRYAFRVESED